MAKTKPKRIQNGALNAPSIDDVFQFINGYMKDWPEKFCHHMAERFVMSYRSKGWKVGKTPMKDFEAAFIGQWKNLKDFGDKKLLEQYQMEPIHQARLRQEREAAAGLFRGQEDMLENAAKIDIRLDRLTELQNSLIGGKITSIGLWAEYDGLKRLGIMRVPKPQIDQIMILKGESNERGKALMVEYLFRNLNHAGITIKQFFYQIHRHAKENDSSPIRQDESKG